MLQPELIQQAASVSIVDYLASKGLQPVKTVGYELLYYSPLREEANPSFWVNPKKNKFKDFTDEKHSGNVITLVMFMETNGNYPRAVQKLLNFQLEGVGPLVPVYTPPGRIQKPIPQQTHIVFPFDRPILIEYVQERGIPYALAKQYLHGVMTAASDRYYFYLGFENDSKGFTLNNRSYKRCLGPQNVTTFDLPSRDTVEVFEGFFDFLTALVIRNQQRPLVPTVVLNSTTNRRKAYAYLIQFNQIHCYLDRDNSGRECLRLMRREGLTVKDCSEVYNGYKDYNDFMTQSPSAES